MTIQALSLLFAACALLIALLAWHRADAAKRIADRMTDVDSVASPSAGGYEEGFFAGAQFEKDHAADARAEPCCQQAEACTKTCVWRGIEEGRKGVLSSVQSILRGEAVPLSAASDSVLRELWELVCKSRAAGASLIAQENRSYAQGLADGKELGRHDALRYVDDTLNGRGDGALSHPVINKVFELASAKRVTDWLFDNCSITAPVNDITRVVHCTAEGNEAKERILAIIAAEFAQSARSGAAAMQVQYENDVAEIERRLKEEMPRLGLGNGRGWRGSVNESNRG